MKKAKSHSWWFQKTKKDYNLYIRLDESNENGLVRCTTCKKILHFKKAHAGHFIHGLHFIRENQHAQCPRCNLFLSGNLGEYALFMLDRYGRQTIDKLKFLKSKPRRYGIPELKEMRAKIKKDIKRLKDTKNEG